MIGIATHDYLRVTIYSTADLLCAYIGLQVTKTLKERQTCQQKKHWTK